MSLLLAFAFTFSLGGCALGPTMIRYDTIEFGETIEDTTNKLLVMNVLRARDKAPLHFADISVIRESIQQSASLGFLSILGDLRGTTQRDTRSGTLAIQKTPSFDINHLHSKEFITGITSPIDPKIVKYWLDRGLDRRIVLLLFFSAVEIVETHSAMGPVNTIRISNSPRDAAEIIKARRQAFGGADALRCDSQSDFERYLKLLNTLRTFSANTYRERRLLARGLNPGTAEDSKNLQAFAALDQTKVQLVYDRERHTYSVYSLGGEQKVAFCFHDEQQAGGSQTSQFEVMDVGELAAGDKRSCFQSVVDVMADNGARRAFNPLRIFFPGPAEVNEPSRYCSVYNQFTGSGVVPAAKPGGYPKLEVKLFIRSVGEIFQFLGDLLHYQDEVRRHLDGNPQLSLKLNSPVTFGYCGDHPEPGCDNIFIRLDGDSCNARFSLVYREREYRVANFNSSSDARCGPDNATRKDHTLEILSVLHQLVGLNKAATDVRTTPTVNVLP